MNYDKLLVKLKDMEIQRGGSRSPRDDKAWKLNKKDITQNKPQLYFSDGSFDVFYALLYCFRKCKLGLKEAPAVETRLMTVDEWFPKLEAWWYESCAFNDTQ